MQDRFLHARGQVCSHSVAFLLARRPISVAAPFVFAECQRLDLMGTSTHVDVSESTLQNILAILCRLPKDTAVTVAVVALAIPDCGGTGLFAKLLYVPIRQDAHRRIVHGNALGGAHRPEAHQRHNHEAGELEEILPRGHVGCHRLFTQLVASVNRSRIPIFV